MHKAISLLFLIFVFFASYVHAQMPIINSFTPIKANVGASVTLTGTNFNPTPANNIVFFGAIKGIVTTATTTSLIVNVPSGATYAPITVLNTVTALSASSTIKFIPTFIPNSTSIAETDFDAKIDLATGNKPQGLAIGDFDGDGKVDVAVVNNSSNTVSLFRNTGSNNNVAFASKIDIVTGTEPVGIAVGDIDGDGKLDIAVANQGTANGVCIFRNSSSNGLISFDNKIDVATVLGTTNVVIGDIDGDGRNDIAATSISTNIVYIIRNTTIGNSISFATKADLTAFTQPICLAIGDLNNDSKPDLIVSNFFVSISILSNTSAPGIISFAPRVNITTGNYPNAVSISDIDGDGQSDIVVANTQDMNVSVFRNTGTGGSVSFEVAKNFPTFYSPAAFAVGDINGDGKPDLAVSNNLSGGTKLSILNNTSSTGNVSFASKIDIGNFSNPWGVAIGDMDGDGKPDLVVANNLNTANTVSIVRNNILSNTNLSALTISAGVLGPAFSPANHSYIVGVLNTTTSVTVTPTAQHASSTIQVRINGGIYNTVASGSASAVLLTSQNSNTIEVLVTAADGITTAMYTLLVVKGADLAGLTVSSGSLNPVFSSDITSYSTAAVSFATTSVTVLPTAADPGALIEVRINNNSYSTVTNGTNSGALQLNTGLNTINIKVTSQGATLAKVYVITVTRNEGLGLSVLTVSTGALSPAFASNITAYSTADVSATTSSVTVTPTVLDPTSIVQVRNGGGWFITVTSGATSLPLQLYEGLNTLEIKVTSQTGTFKVYTISVSRQSNINANLSALTISSSTFAFYPAMAIYNVANVENSTAFVTVTPTANNLLANIGIRINGGNYVPVISGTASPALALNIGSNTIDIKVTAPDGVNVNIYTIQIRRKSNADLSNLTISSGALSPAFTSATTDYNASPVTYGTNVSITATVMDPAATIQVVINGANYINITSNAASTALPLNVGNNIIDMKVTGQDGMIVKIYSITIIRQTNAQPPIIVSFSPLSGPVGTIVTVSGINLDNPTAFTIGSVAVVPIRNNGVQLVAMVMPGSVTGEVAITTLAGNATSSGSFTILPTPYPNAQYGNKLIATENIGQSHYGSSVAVSADGSTAIVGGYTDNVFDGAAWVYVNNTGVWVLQAKLIGAENNMASFGQSVAISADGNAVVVGGGGDNNGIGATWVFTRNGTTWSQQGQKLIGTDGLVKPFQGTSVAISADGNTILVGGPYDDTYFKGAVWVFVRNGIQWKQQGSKLVGSGSAGLYIQQGISVAISADGNTALVGANDDNNSKGAAWIFTRNNNIWTQQGNKLVGTGAIGNAKQGTFVALNANGNTAVIGGPTDNNNIGATWVFTRNGNVWTQQGSKLVGTGNSGISQQGNSVSVSGDGNTLLVGAPSDNSNQGATWVFARNGTTWTQKARLIGSGNIGAANQGATVFLSPDGTTAMVGGNTDFSNNGACWMFNYSSATVPVTITNFKAYQKNTNIQVEWQTKNEINLSSYEVEKSTNGTIFEKLGSLPANGSAGYLWLDGNPANGNNYYRLKMMDKDGSFKYSSIVNVKIGGIKNVFTVAGNPIKNNTVVLQLENVEKGNYAISIYNNLGQQIISKTIAHEGGSATQALYLAAVSAGTYQLSIIGKNVKVSKTIVVE